MITNRILLGNCMKNSEAIRNAISISLGVTFTRIAVCRNNFDWIDRSYITYITLLGPNMSVDHNYSNEGPEFEILRDQNNEIANNKAYLWKGTNWQDDWKIDFVRR